MRLYYLSYVKQRDNLKITSTRALNTPIRDTMHVLDYRAIRLSTIYKHIIRYIEFNVVGK